MKLKKIMAIGLAVASLGLMNLSSTASAADSDYPPVEQVEKQLKKQKLGTIYPIGKPNVAYEKYFTGRTFYAPLAHDSISVGNVTFTRGAHTFWHIHHGSCQILVPESGRGYYQLWGEEPQELIPGVVATIPEGVKHWHGAAPGTLMQHLSIMQVGDEVTTEWLEPVDETFYASLK
ncbi:MAG: cupin domain-containing protein [Selenomonadaceae bacterium]|nr:cupin domain-containing protein [Selenomonadaceae bacterium]